MSKRDDKIEKFIEDGAKWIGVYEGHITDLSGDNLIEAIKDFNSHWNSTLSGIYDVENEIMYHAKENDEPDCRGYYNNSYYIKGSNKVYYNEDEETRPIVKLKPVPVGKGVEHGYIDRNGRIYECGFEAHRELAKELFLSKTITTPDDYSEFGSDVHIDEMGWVKISSKRVHYKFETRLSLSQKKTIVKWMEAVGNAQYEFQYDMMSVDEIIMEIND